MTSVSEEMADSSSSERTVYLQANVAEATPSAAEIRARIPVDLRGSPVIPAAVEAERDTPEVMTVLIPRAQWTPGAGKHWAWSESSLRRRSSIRRKRIIISAVVLLFLGAAVAVAVATAFVPPEEAPAAVVTNSHAPIVVPGPTIPVPVSSGPGADITKPATPAGLRVTGRSETAVSIVWAEAIDDVGIAGYVVTRNGAQVGTTHDPGFTDGGLQSQNSYQYAVAAFDAAGNVSAASERVTAVTLRIPDRSPPSVPAGLQSSGQSMNTIVLAWSASQDNVGVAGYEVYRNGDLIANAVQSSHTDVGLSPATSYTYRVRAFDTSNNASADSNTITVATAVVPDTTAPSVPSGVGAIGTSPSEIDVSWTASTDNVGVTSYQVYRDGVQVAHVVGTGFTDQGLAASTPYGYEVRASDAAGNHSGPSASTTASTLAAPTTNRRRPHRPRRIRFRKSCR